MKIAYPLLLAWLMLFSSTSFGAIVNGGFENSTQFFGWTEAGLTSIETSAFGIAPTELTHQARLHTGDSGEGNLLALATALNVSESDITNFLPTAFSGSAISQSIIVDNDDILNFDWNFVTTESSTTKQDTAFFTLRRASEAPEFFFLANPTPTPTTSAPAPYTTQTGYHTVNPSVPFTFDFAGTYVLGFGVVNSEDANFPSGLLIDNVRVTAVPEPTALAGLGLVGLALTMRRRRRR